MKLEIGNAEHSKFAKLYEMLHCFDGSYKRFDYNVEVLESNLKHEEEINFNVTFITNSDDPFSELEFIFEWENIPYNDNSGKYFDYSAEFNVKDEVEVKELDNFPNNLVVFYDENNENKNKFIQFDIQRYKEFVNNFVDKFDD